MSSHHIISASIREGAEVMNSIWWDGERLKTDQYQHADLVRNGVELPKEQKGALIEQISYQSNFYPLTGYIQGLLEQIKERADVFELAYVQKQSQLTDVPLERIKHEANKSKRYVMAHEFRGVQYFIRMGLQEQGIKEAQLEPTDMLLAVKSHWSHECSADELRQFLADLAQHWDMNKIAGNILDSLNEGGCFVGAEGQKVGVEAFRAGCSGKTLSYDKFYIKREFPAVQANKGFAQDAAVKQPKSVQNSRLTQQAHSTLSESFTRAKTSGSVQQTNLAEEFTPAAEEFTPAEAPDFSLDDNRSRYFGGASQQQKDDELILASRWTRFGAATLDMIILVTINFFVAIPIIDWFVESYDLGYVLRLFIIFVSSLLLYIVINSSFLIGGGQTIGKKVMGIRIVTMDGKAASGWKLCLRCLVITVISWLFSYVAIVSLLLIFTKSRRCLHDHIVGTQVVVANLKLAPAKQPSSAF